MKVLHVNASACYGSGIAASRLVSALRKAGIECEFIYWRPFIKSVAKICWLEKKLNGLVNIILRQILGSCSVNVLPSSLLKTINRSDADIVHLHWINAEMISIAQISKIEKPIVWTFHDMWPVCGIKHCSISDTSESANPNWFCGTTLLTKRCLDWIDKWTVRRKIKYFSKIVCTVISPSSWLAECVLRCEWIHPATLHVVPNCIDLSVFCPQDNVKLLKNRFKINCDSTVIVFPTSRLSYYKGIDLLNKALALLSHPAQYVVVVVGASGTGSLGGLDTVWLGSIQGDKEMAELYSIADVACVPSRIESFCQCASEPQACGVPVVAFNATGLKDIVEHKVTGYLARPYDPEDFARGIEWVLGISRFELGQVARCRAEEMWCTRKVASKVCTIYEALLSKYKS